MTTKINNLNNPKYQLNAPVSVIISYDDGLYYAEAVDFNVYSEGNDGKEALDNIKTAIISYYESLMKHEKRLSKKMDNDFKILSKLIIHERRKK